ncbi:helix-turn-helix domain-containing protein [Paraburkholderia phosphatilytica]|uniref:helix-turn-helix domain-containing protein n=1 Tax=Paraburkholderia phosphatilytica TaxID=2282883 RepID=UPI000E4EFA7E|nr:helix-turn-helix domain-containing protein [Paraburkholderia phosphatilytica]
MSEPQHPQPHETDTNASRPGPTAVPHPAVQPVLDSLPAVGARLAQLRESKGWSIDDVSSRLKVSAAKLRALEAGDISHLPDATFAAGVIRSYAKMLGADPEPFTQALRREKGVAAPKLSMPASSGRDLPRGRVSLSLGNSSPKRRSWLWGVAAVIVAVIAIGMWHTNGGDSSAWLARLKATANGAAGGANSASATVAQGETAASGSAADTGAQAGSQPASQADAQAAPAESADNGAASQVAMPTPLTSGNAQAPAPTAQTPAPMAQAATGASQPAQAAQAAQKPAAGASAAAVANASAAAAASGAQAEAGESIVTLRVSEDSWFSVRQKDGKEVFSGLVSAGESKEVQGQPPLKVTVGNKAGLESMTLDGVAVDQSKYSSARGNVARFTLP